jgi:methyl-accepting chemotaxis protein PixJ
VYDSIAVGDPTGKTILQITGQAITRLEERDYFKAAIATKQPVITPPRKSALNGKYSIFLAAPIVNINNNKITGVVRTRISVEKLEPIAQMNTSAMSQNKQKRWNTTSLMWKANSLPPPKKIK